MPPKRVRAGVHRALSRAGPWCCMRTQSLFICGTVKHTLSEHGRRGESRNSAAQLQRGMAGGARAGSERRINQLEGRGVREHNGGRMPP